MSSLFTAISFTYISHVITTNYNEFSSNVILTENTEIIKTVKIVLFLMKIYVSLKNIHDSIAERHKTE